MRLILIVVSSTALILGYFLYQASNTTTPISGQPQQALVGDPNVPIGGDFTLTKSDGSRLSSDALKGKPSLYYFGYTWCPDVCPLDLQKLSLALENLEERGYDLAALNSVFITIDPERDTPEVMGQYAKSYHPDILPLSGSVDDIQQVKDAFRVYAVKDIEGETVPEDYLVSHSNMMYLMDVNGYYIKHFTDLSSYKEIADTIAQVLDQQ